MAPADPEVIDLAVSESPTVGADQFGGFELGPLAAQGSTIDAFLAQHRQLAWTAICKRPRRSDDGVALARLTREAIVLAGVRHPALPRLYFFDAQLGALVEEQLGGEPLSSYLASDVQHAVELTTAVGLLAAVAEAVATLHRSGFAHGHLQSKHVLLQPDGSFRLLGAGLRSTNAQENLPALQLDDQRALGFLGEALCGVIDAPVPDGLRNAIAAAQLGSFASCDALLEALRAVAATTASATEPKPVSARAAAIAAVKTIALPPGAPLGSPYALPPPARWPSPRAVSRRRSALPTVGWMLLGATLGTAIMACLWLVSR